MLNLKTIHNYFTKMITSLPFYGMMMISLPAFAEDAASAGSAALSWAYLAAGIAIGLAVLGGTSAQGKAASTAYESIGRNPQSSEKIFLPLVLGLALIEAQTILAFIIAILLVFKV